MTAFEDYNNELNRVYDSFSANIRHSYMELFVDDPVIDKDQAVTLYFLLKERRYSAQYIHDCILTTLFVQAALDTHETVGSHGLGTDTQKTERQLTVLAGDYYSSLYYFVLSKVKDVALIRVLARSIQEINEAKMNIYHQRRRKIKPSVDDLKLIQASLVKNIAVMAGLPEKKQMLEEFFLLKMLLKDRFVYLEAGAGSKAVELFRGADNFNLSRPGTDYVTDEFNRHIMLAVNKLRSAAINQDQTAGYIRQRTEELLTEFELKEQCAVEEG